MPKLRRKTLSVAGATLCAGLLVGTLAACGNDSAGNGIADKSAKEISDAAQQELLDATSLRMELDAGEAATDGPRSFDLAVDQDGNCAGTFEMAGDKGSFEILKVGEKVWMKADTAFWKASGGPQGEAVAALIGDKYLAGDTSDPQMASLSSSCNLKELQKEMESDSDSEDLKKGDASTVDGTPTITVLAKDDKDGENSTIHVATEGEPYPLKIVSEKEGKEQTVKFSDFDEPVPSDPPADGETVDLAELEKLQQSQS